MRVMTYLIAALAALFAASTAYAHDFGPAVGDRLPAAVEGQDQTGAAKSLADVAGRNGTVIAFVRAADWCPYCQQQLIGLEGVRGPIGQRGWTLVAVTTDTVEELARFAQQRAIGYTMISDEDSSVIRAFGLLDPQYPEGSRRHGLPVPTILFVSRDGVVRAKLGDADFRVRPTPDVVVSTLDGLNR